MHIDSFISYLQTEKRYSQHTIIAYKSDLTSFQQFLDLEFSIKDITLCTHQFIRTWIVRLIDDNITPKTVTRKISTLKSFFKFLIKNKLVSANPMQKIVLPKVPKRLPNYVPENNMNYLMQDDLFSNDFKGKRDRIILEILYNTGIRLSELIGIKIQDINTIECKVKVLGKRNKERIIPYNNHLSEIINDYMEVRKNQFPSVTLNNLLLTDKGSTLYPKFVYRTVNTYLSKVTTISKKSPHVIRHTFATHMLNNGADINAIKELLGHSSLAATQVYTHNSIEKLKNIYKQAHPKA
jgi:integrase/recombinase XerC